MLRAFERRPAVPPLHGHSLGLYFRISTVYIFLRFSLNSGVCRVPTHSEYTLLR